MFTNTSKINFCKKLVVNFWGAPFRPNPRFYDTSIFYLSQLKKRYVAIFDITSGSLANSRDRYFEGGFSPPGYATGEVNVDVKR
jgi:hypothetical protein